MSNVGIPRHLRDQLIEISRRMRANPTFAERKLWHYLRNWQISNFKFRRQHVVNRFIVDFYCSEAKLIVEVDGEIHRKQRELDKERDILLHDLGYAVFRVTNQEVIMDIANVLNRIHAMCVEATTNRPKQSPFPLERGRDGEGV